MKPIQVNRILHELFNSKPLMIDDEELQKGINRVAREQGFSFQLMDNDGINAWIITLPPQVALDRNLGFQYFVDKNITSDYDSVIKISNIYANKYCRGI